jgi:hypothetical protein
VSDLYELRRVTNGRPEPCRDGEGDLPMKDAWEALERAKTAAEAEGWTVEHFSPRRFFFGYRADRIGGYMTVGVHRGAGWAAGSAEAS